MWNKWDFEELYSLTTLLPVRGSRKFGCEKRLFCLYFVCIFSQLNLQRGWSSNVLLGEAHTSIPKTTQ